MSRSVSDVSVITVNWNGRAHLESLLPSLTPLGAREIIVVDNGSTDGSQAFLRRQYPQVVLLENPANRGFSEPNNMAAARAQGRYIALINNDMRAHPAWLSAALPKFENGVVCVGSRILDWNGEHIDFNGSSLQYLGYALQRDAGRVADENLPAPDRILFACGGALIMEREVFLALGGFDPDFFAIFEDVDLGWRTWLAGHEIAFAPDSTVRHRGHATFSGHPNPKMRYLMHRNALLTVLKNYEEETFRKMLPLVVALTLKRAVVFSGVAKENFYLWEQTASRLEAGDSAAWSALLDALNQVVALDDVLEQLPEVMCKRERIQSTRRRSDSEILALFVDPMRTIVEQEAYLVAESRYLDLVGLAPLFGPGKSAEDGPGSDLAGRVSSVKRELSALQWIEGSALLHPPLPESRWGRRLRRIRSKGLSNLWQEFLKRVDRGI